MSRYGDIDKIKNFILANGYVYANKLDEFIEDDVMLVVRCKDCTYKDSAKVNKNGFLICPASGMEITDDDFCSYGKRKLKGANQC